MRKLNEVYFSNTDSASKNGAAIDTNQFFALSFQLFFSSTNSGGTFKLQASNDVPPAGVQGPTGGYTPTNWVDIPNQSATAASGASQLLTLGTCVYRWVRAVWTHSAGSDAMTCEVFGSSV